MSGSSVTETPLVGLERRLPTPYSVTPRATEMGVIEFTNGGICTSDTVFRKLFLGKVTTKM